MNYKRPTPNPLDPPTAPPYGGRGCGWVFLWQTNDIITRDDRHVCSWRPSRYYVTTVTFVRDDHHVVL